MDYKFKLNDIELFINETVFHRLSMFKQSSSELIESGGLLIGRTDINGKTRIYDITEPMKNDVRNRLMFKRLDKRHLDILREANEKCLYFKGNWHTHPQSVPIPSWIDQISWKKAMKESKPGDSEFIFFIIVGTEQTKVWCGNMITRIVFELEYDEVEEGDKSAI